MIGESSKLYFELLTDDRIAEIVVLTKEVEEGDEIIMHALLRKNHDLDSRGDESWENNVEKKSE